MHYTYVLHCESTRFKDLLYIGSTSDLRERIAKHKSKTVKTTKKFDKITLIYYEACISRKDAYNREMKLKTGFGRGYIKRRLNDYLKSRD